MNDYWHIPRASLSPSSASSAVSSISTERSDRSQNKKKLTPTHYRQHQQQKQKQQHQPTGVMVKRGNGERRDSEMSAATTSAAVTAAAAAAVLAAAKRGSRSSQGSDDSNNSTRSAASGSLLLTAANLERMAEIHKKQQQNHHLTSLTHSSDLVRQDLRGYEIRTITSIDGKEKVHNHQHDQQVEKHQNQTQNDAVINIDPNLNFIKTKDLDTVSIASSMHFTMVNGETGANKKIKKGLCDRGRQVTVLIVTMSAIFLLLIIGMVYALEMRAREMPQS